MRSKRVETQRLPVAPASGVRRSRAAPGPGAPGRLGARAAGSALADGSCLIEVSDESQQEPRLRAVGEWEEAGRGLHLVENLAAAWGVWGRGRHGKTVWALIIADLGP